MPLEGLLTGIDMGVIDSSRCYDSQSLLNACKLVQDLACLWLLHGASNEWQHV